MILLVYETKFAVEKTQEKNKMQERGEVVGGDSTLGGIRKRCLDKTLGTAMVRKLASKQAMGVRGIASHHK